MSARARVRADALGPSHLPDLPDPPPGPASPRWAPAASGSPTALALLLGAGALVGCSGEPAGGPPPGWSDQVGLSELVDLDPSPSVLEVELPLRVESFSFRADAQVPLFTYGGTIPGPLLRAKAGDRVIVHAHNQLEVETTIHWHGVRVPVEMDGVPEMSQPPIQPGQTFTYDFVVPDAGLYWYHSHVESPAQVGFGLYGALLVEPAEAEPEGLGDEVVLVLSDLGLREDGSLVPADSGGAAGSLFGREGDVVLVNGREDPTLLARSGRRQRLRLVNAAKSRYFQLELPGHTFTVLGVDGGLRERPVEQERVVLASGERLDVVITPTGAPGERLPLRWVPYDRGYGSTEFREPEDLAFIELSDLEPELAPPLPETLRAISPTPRASATQVDLSLTLHSTDEEAWLGIDGLPSWEAPPLEAMIGETQVWRIVNETDWDHPFHLHGFFFQVDEPGAPLGWKDTVNVPKRDERTFVVRFDERPGMWMFHCHILDHAEIGMMGMLDLTP